MNEKTGPKAGPEAPAKALERSVADAAIADGEHGATVAADALPWFNRLEWDLAIRQEAKSGREFSADTLQEHYDLPSLGQGATGGVFMAAHRSGLIRRTGWRPSTRPSRAGSVVACWVGTGHFATAQYGQIA